MLHQTQGLRPTLSHTLRPGGPRTLLGVALLAGALLLIAGCGGSTAASTAAPADGKFAAPGIQNGSTHQAASAGSANSSTSQQSSGTTRQSPVADGTYLIKSLSVSMTVPDPRKTAADLQTWVVATDPHATTAGSTYQQIDTNRYNVTLIFSIPATTYPQAQRYLSDYAETHNGHLVDLRETTQDVTTDYVDTQSRLSNLRNEQQRLQGILDKAQTLTDVLAIEQRLTDVEGQIESTEAHLNALNGKTTFYAVTVNLYPLDATTPTHPTPFDPGKTLSEALGAALVAAVALASLLIWVAVFAVFLLPVAVVVWLVRRRIAARQPVSVAPPPTPALPTA